MACRSSNSFFSEGSYYSLTYRAHTQPLCGAAGHWVFWSGLSLHCDRRSHHHLPHLQCGLLFYSPAPKHTQAFAKWDGFKGHLSLRERILKQHKPWAWRRDRIVGLSGCSRGKDQCRAIYDLPQCQDTQPPLGGIYTGPTPYTGMPAVSQTTYLIISTYTHCIKLWFVTREVHIFFTCLQREQARKLMVPQILQ